MHVLCAPDSFKGTLDAGAAAAAMGRGVTSPRGVTADLCPLGDGGEGTLDALVSALAGDVQSAEVTGPLGEPVEARFGLVPSTGLGIVELASASGLTLVPETRRDPTMTTSYGTGELMRRAHQAGAERLLVCIGGSATVDGGTGLAQAFGVRFYDAQGNRITEPLRGCDLDRIERWDAPAGSPPVTVAYDVANPLCGERGAATIYGPQKGATSAQVARLEAGLAHLAARSHVDPCTPGAGAAGGAAFGLMTFLHASMQRGIDYVLAQVDFESRCRAADLVLTGEGRLDAQTFEGKVVHGVAAIANACDVPVQAIVGDLGPGAAAALKSHGGPLDGYVSLVERFGRERAFGETAGCLEEAAREAISE